MPRGVTSDGTRALGLTLEVIRLPLLGLAEIDKPQRIGSTGLD
jgi:hypothetical protein